MTDAPIGPFPKIISDKILLGWLSQTIRLVCVASFFAGIAANWGSAQTKLPTVTSLSVSASSVAAGTVVTLTARVTASGANVRPGQVNFCDATAVYCSDIHILATAQLTSSGTSTYKFRPGIGSHSYKAVFVGTNSYAGSISSASSLTVTGTIGPFATATSIAETGAWGNYTLTGTVTEAGGTVAPTGTVSFLDASNGNSVLATGSLGSAVAGVGWPNPGSLPNTQGTNFVLVADLNGDGISDLVLGSNQVSIYLGKADGTYTATAAPSIQGPTSYPIAIADFNGDGIPDVAVPLYGSNEIAILLGKGNGTFAAPVMVSVPSATFGVGQILVGDLNGDGISDLAALDSNNSAVNILLGNGDGTFTSEATRPTISGIPLHFATGDFNGDGKVDFAVAVNDGTVAILLGNGDGTFSALGSVNSGIRGSPIAVADVNGDGKLDIAVAAGTGASESVVVLTGNGNGTFNSPFSGPGSTSSSVTWIQVADFNQDGAADVILADSSGGATTFLNDGTGSLDRSFPVVSGLSVPSYLEVGVGDLNGDGYPDIAAGGYYSSAQRLYLTEPTQTASATASVQVNGVGQHLAKASFPAESNYQSSVSSAIPLWGLLPVTSTMLSVTSGGSAVTSVRPGTTVLLSAHVGVGTIPVTAGQVNFCDAYAPHCTDIHILGSSALNSSGIATFKFVPGAGAHSYQAQFVEDGFGLASASNVASLTVGPAPSPVYSDTAAITWNGSPGDYSLTATVTGYGGPASPSGAVSFVDTSFGNTVLATASLGAGIPGIGFLESLSPSFGSYPAREATADFNGDGIPDLAIISSDNSFGGGPFIVAVFLGKGDGTFQTGPTIQPSDMWIYPSMISGDFNGDGKPDLAILSYDGSTTSYLTILLNNGDGSFSAKPTVVAYKQGSTGGDVILGTLAAADFNGDGKLDLAVVGDYVSSGGVTILLGKGDGTFTSAGPNLDPSGDFALIATGDFNGDGIPDFVTPNYFEFGGSPTIFLGKGDGSFTFSKVTFTLDYFPTSVVVGDFNGDGVFDLAFSDLNGVEIALGKGDGTFNETSGSPIAVPTELYSLQIGDFNHDGKIDLAGWDTYFGQIVLLLGAGDGTFAVTEATPGVSPSTFGIHQMAAADFNGDGVPDLALLTYSVNTASILLTVPTETTTATVDHIAPVGAGTHDVDASYAGDSHYGAATSNTIELTAGLAPLVVNPAPGTYTSAQTLTITEKIPGSTIYFALTGPVSTNGYVQYIGPVSLPYSGVETLQAYATETGYFQSNDLLAQYTINLNASTTVTLSSVPNPSVVGQVVKFTATVTSGSGTPPDGEIVTFKNGSAVLGTGPLSAGIAVLSTSSLASGIHTVTASYSGDSTFAAATSPAIRQVVNTSTKSATSTALTSSLNPLIYGQTVTWTANVTTTGPFPPTGKISFSWGGHFIGVATLNANGVATLTKSNFSAGSNPLTAQYFGDANSLPSTSAILNQVVTQASSAATLTASPNPSSTGEAVTFKVHITSPTVTAKGPVTFKAGKTVLGTVQLANGKASFVTSILPVGTTKVTAAYFGDSNIAKSSASVAEVVKP